ncbi:MFS transporter [Thermococcus sp. 21S9]|uniref:MFS transporter n=1 Tax=Thermococcus sp. 21S9 TaxID=1638223 RepID=UPI00143BD651|nr:MFS transporter [Thermococcus sp. 21S9]NJE54789.1 MFS transporter [Thermococcus sp. 21S9]
MSLQKYRGFSRDAWLLVAYSFIAWLGGNIAWFILPFYMKSLGYTYGDVGVVFSASTLSQAVALLFSGPLSARLGYKRSILLGLGLMFSGRAIQAAFPSLLPLAIGGALVGVGLAFESPSFTSLLSGEVSDEKRHYLFSLSSALGTIGSAVGLIIAGVLPKWLTYRETFALVLLVIPLRFLVILPTRPVLNGGRRIKLRGEILRRIAKFAVPQALIGLGAGIAIPYVGLWFNQRFGTSLESIGWLFAVQQFIMGLGTFLLPIIADRMGSVKTIVAFNGSASALIALMPLSPSFPVAALLYTVRTILMNIVNPIWSSFMMGFFSEEERSTAMALNNLSWTATFGVGQFIGGFIFDVSLTWPFFITAILYSLSMAVFWETFKKED